MRGGPDFIIIGAMKCATTTLHAQLAVQPGVYMSTPKEPNFFSDEAVWSRGFDWYESLFAAAPEGALRGEASTHYTKLPTYPDTAARIFDHLHDVRLIYIMRHPIDRLVSHYIHEWSRRRTDAPIDEAVGLMPELIDYGRYAMQLEPFLARFGPEAVLPVFFERLAAHGQEQLERVGAFIAHRGSMRWQDESGAKNVSAERERPSRLRATLRRVPGLRPLVRRLLPEPTRRRWRRRLWGMGSRPDLGAEERLRLERVFDEDLARLGDWLGVRLSCANFAAGAERASFRFRGQPTSVNA